jgi:pimeloyl-ACP methyl ester carboxylesterase
MTTSTEHVTEARLAVADTALHVLQGGTGAPVLVLHGIEGFEGWLPFHDALARQATVYAPSHPGYGQTACPPWLESIMHQAVFYQWFLEQHALAPVDIVGIDIGGWIAAYMAVLCPHTVRRLVLVDAAGMRPQQAEILDVFIIPWQQAFARGFYDAANCPEYQRLFGGEFQEYGGAREPGRVMSMRMCFRPYMYDAALPGMLAKIHTPTLIVWGAQDQIMPLECAHLYQQAIAGASLEVLERCGHWPQFERPQELAQVIGEFLSR